MHVFWNDQELLLKILPIEFLSDNNEKSMSVLIIIERTWIEFYKFKIEEMSKQKMKIFSSLSHELRTPLNCTISMLQILKEEIN